MSSKRLVSTGRLVSSWDTGVCLEAQPKRRFLEDSVKYLLAAAKKFADLKHVMVPAPPSRCNVISIPKYFWYFYILLT